eukprot:294098-Rhodomonas_salina.2
MLRENLLTLDVKDKQCDKVIIQGIQAAITEEHQVCVAHKELVKSAPKAFGPHQLHQYTKRGVCKHALIVPPKQARCVTWQRDSGW